ncbi:MAG: lytic transglycosylase domain-containing protein [Sulfurospirillum sp.]
MPFRARGIAVLLCLLTPFLLYAQMPQDFSSFHKLPRSIAKDYYIYRYLNERNVTGDEAQKLLEQTKRVNFKLFYSIAKKIKDKGFEKVSKCLKLKTDLLLKTDDECIAIGLSISDALTLDKNTTKNLSKRLKKYKDINETMVILSSGNILQEALKKSKKFIEIFNKAGPKNRKKLFNKKISKEEINRLANFKEFNRSIEIIVTQRELKNLQKSLLHVEANQNLTQKSLFFLGLNALEQNRKILALNFLDKAYKKAYYRFDKDKIIFWKYLLTKDEKYTQELNSSFDVNIYTIYAHEKYSTKFTNIISPDINSTDKNYDIQNPFLWTTLLQEIKDQNKTTLEKTAKSFRHKNTIGQYAFLLEKAKGYKTHYFPMPFFSYLSTYTNKRKSLILAIARQESRFIPASVSTSYALGMMQFMPFLAIATAKNQKIKNFDTDEMFDPKIAYKFANLHLNYLVKKLHHPLLVAYAYNGGIGYTKRLLKSGNFFTKSQYEPFFSMETISYPETRKYGKKVLANYIIYMQLLGEKVSLDKLITNLK